MNSILAVITTFRCNLKCVYCYNETHDGVASGYANKEERELSPQLIADLVKELQRYEYNRLVLTGGEPLATRSTRYWLEQSEKSGLATTLITNLSALPASYEEQIVSHPALLVTVSLSGHEASHHNRLRAKFGPTMANVKRLISQGVRIELSVVVDATNVSKIDEIERFASDLSVGLHLAPVSLRTDNGLDYLSLKNLRREDWASALDRCRSPRTLAQLSLIKGAVTGTAKVHTCHMRTRTQVLDPFGNLIGCFFREDIRWGNFIDENPTEVLARIPRSEVWEAGCFGEKCIPLHYH